MPASNDVTHVWLFGTPSLKHNSIYLYPAIIYDDLTRAAQNRTYIPMTCVDSNEHIYYCQFRTVVNAPNIDNIGFRICSIDEQSLNIVKQTGQPPETTIIQGPNDCNHTIDNRIDGWLIGDKQTVFLLDFKNYSKRKFSLTSSSKERMLLHYCKIIKLCLSYLLSQCNINIAPNIIIKTVFELYSLICSDYKIHGTPIKNVIKQICSKYCEKIVIETARNWHELSFGLTSMFLLTSIATQTVTCINDDLLVLVYSRLTNEKLFGNGQNVLKQIDNILGEYVSFFQTRFYNRIILSKLAMSKYKYLLWYNLLNQKTPDSQISQRLNIIHNNLTPKFKGFLDLDELIELVKLDVYFDCVNHNYNYNNDNASRCVPLELEFLKILLDSKNDKMYHLYNVLEIIEDISSIYQIIVLNQVKLVKFLGDTGHGNTNNNNSSNNNNRATVENAALQAATNSFENWYQFVVFLLKKCKIKPNSSVEDLNALDDVTKTVISLVITLFAPHIQKISEAINSQLLYDLLVKFPILTEETVGIAILNNDFLNKKYKFFIFFGELLSTMYTKKMDLKKFMPFTLTEKLNLLKSKLNFATKQIIISSIDCHVNQLSKQQQNEICNNCIHLLSNGFVDVCDFLVKQIIKLVSSTFNNNNSVNIGICKSPNCENTLLNWCEYVNSVLSETEVFGQVKIESSDIDNHSIAKKELVGSMAQLFMILLGHIKNICIYEREINIKHVYFLIDKHPMFCDTKLTRFLVDKDFSIMIDDHDKDNDGEFEIQCSKIFSVWSNCFTIDKCVQLANKNKFPVHILTQRLVEKVLNYANGNCKHEYQSQSQPQSEMAIFEYNKNSKDNFDYEEKLDKDTDEKQMCLGSAVAATPIQNEMKISQEWQVDSNELDSLADANFDEMSLIQHDESLKLVGKQKKRLSEQFYTMIGDVNKQIVENQVL